MVAPIAEDRDQQYLEYKLNERRSHCDASSLYLISLIKLGERADGFVFFLVSISDLYIRHCQYIYHVNENFFRDSICQRQGAALRQHYN